MRKRILYYALKYDGNYDLIHKAMINHEPHFECEYKGLYVTIGSSQYPEKLKLLKKPPYIIFYKGNLSLLSNDSIGVVGSRKANTYAIEMTKRFLEKLPCTTVVSGMAKGIDTIAHKSAIRFKHRTIAVLGSGIDYVYPYENKRLYDFMSEHELVVSEYPGTVKPKPYFFPFRNRIIAALSEEIYVMQAGIYSGTLLTVNEALELNKDIYVLPYRLNDEGGKGCNLLIQQGANIILD